MFTAVDGLINMVNYIVTYKGAMYVSVKEAEAFNDVKLGIAKEKVNVLAQNAGENFLTVTFHIADVKGKNAVTIAIVTENCSEELTSNIGEIVIH